MRIYFKKPFTVLKVGWSIEIYNNCAEISNNGKLLADGMFLIDYPPKSRNAKLTLIMRPIGMCYGVGFCIVTIIDFIESMHLPTLKFGADEKDFEPLFTHILL